MRHVAFYDTTLRDGEQSPGISFTREARVAIATALDAMGVSEIEIGFAASGAQHAADMHYVGTQGLKARLTSLARPIPGDIDAVLAAGLSRVVLFYGASDMHLEKKFEVTEDEALSSVLKGVTYAKSKGLFTQFSFEDATRTPVERLIRWGGTLAEAGCDRIGLADTLGVGTPVLMTEMTSRVKKSVSLPVSVHCHDDFGMAVANSVAAVLGGADMLSTTMNGIGERSGNAATEVCATALSQLHGYEVDIDLAQIAEVSALVYRCASLPQPLIRPVAGKNTFRHESGIHVAAILKDPATYEPYSPHIVGGKRELCLGKTTGRNALRHLLGAEAADAEELDWLLAEIKARSEGGAPPTLPRIMHLLQDYRAQRTAAANLGELV